jgi:uncharacterized protein (TIGR02145 family)
MNLFLVVLLTISSFSYSQTVTIGNQVWTTKNLDVDRFRNGDTIAQAKTVGEWNAYGQAGEPAWCYYDNDEANGAKYGKLYNWYAVADPRGLAPIGYHLPTDGDWSTLITYLGGEEIAGAKMKSKEGWAENGIGTNSSGFSGLPGGYRYDLGVFINIGYDADWWSVTGGNTYYAWSRFLVYNNGSVYRNYFYKQRGLSVRCIMD